MLARIAITSGLPEPLGALAVGVGVNFAVVSQSAERIEVSLFDAGDREVARLALRRVGDVHCGFITGIGPGTRYGFRADGPYDPARGHWFDPSKLLVDPYATALDRPFVHRAELAAPRPAAIDTAAFVPKAIVAGSSADRAAPTGEPARNPGFTYEIAVKAFTRNHPAVPAPLRGTVAALAHPVVIEHLVALGVDTVELMPVAAWIDERHLQPLGLHNAWGYNPIVFMAPDPRLAPGGLGEVRATVTALHEAGIRVVLDAVYNHTGESDAEGPTLSLRGLDNALYYRHAENDPGLLVDDTGCGNTLATDRPAVAGLVLDAMRRWVASTGIDGFRLDLATVLGRTADGFRSDAPLLAAVGDDPVLSRLIMIAEPWDVGPGGYQLGNFPNSWAEWNDRFRDDVRRFWRGDAGSLATLATRLAGSADIFRRAGRGPSASVNLLAAHDGFTLDDLVSFAEKHNDANGESNRDGATENLSWNNGIEGGTDDAGVEVARRCDVRALLATLFVARGTPMLTAGDELGRTQSGNNNAYAQDNPLTWLDWANADRELAAFTARLSRLRKEHPSLSVDRFLDGEPLDASGIADVAWLHPDGRGMTTADWQGDGRVLGMQLHAAGDRTVTWINGGRVESRAWLPVTREGHDWRLIADSSDESETAPAPTAAGRIVVPPRSVMLFAEF